ncbi:hypothetical protein [Allosphingosinicella sp.]|jgi:hypothetical protein|uniref:hypothetical protein n=1 Tax=Allosphingosinicella sp. TaxID=2823234 RepID=UPI002F0448CB
MDVTIIRRPDGEAPEWVRDAWIGLRLPVARPQSTMWRAFGILSVGPGLLAQLVALIRDRSIPIEGYAVKAEIAVRLLAERNPVAADWWSQNTPKLLDGRSLLVFEEAACALEAE